MDARDHPTVRRGTPYLRGKTFYLALLLVALGVAVLVRDLTPAPVIAALACFIGAGLSVWLGEWQVKDLRHEYRYEDEE